MSRTTVLTAAALGLLVGVTPATAEAALSNPGSTPESHGTSRAHAPLDTAAINAEPDDRIQAAVERALAEDPALSGSQIDVVSVHHGVVLLSGETATYTAQFRAIGAASRVPGVREVRTRLHSAIEPVAHEDSRDDQARDQPDRLGLKDKASQIDLPRPQPVPLNPGVATTVDKASDAVTGAVESAGSSVVGATRDAWITAATKTELLMDPDVPAWDVNVDTADGIVTLFGIVPSRAAKHAATRVAGEVTGVRAVDNALEVVPEATQEQVAVEDDAVQTHAARALERSAILEDEDITVDVKNGVARLTGNVSDNVDRVIASSMVRATPGVRAVNNDLRVAAE